MLTVSDSITAVYIQHSTASAAVRRSKSQHEIVYVEEFCEAVTLKDLPLVLIIYITQK